MVDHVGTAVEPPVKERKMKEKKTKTAEVAPTDVTQTKGRYRVDFTMDVF